MTEMQTDPRPGVADAHPLEQADIAAAEELGRWRDHPAVRVLGKLSELGDQPPLFALSGAVLAAGLVTRNPRLSEAGVRMLAAMALATLLKGRVKKAVSRTRPHVLMEQGRYQTMAGGPDEGPWNSFPSGHTAGSVAVARALSRVYPRAGVAAAPAAAAIALVQVPRGAHYPLDVAGGLAVGLLAEALTDAAVRAAKRIAR
ncbi:MAG TPA: phosphatase PAP2 family protein [Caulobacteraceae bacterium]|nr:phosphatase PAP2 family protein [Caulobacteraceae bacterium]